ncbi:MULTISPECIES: L-rhamnose mutarotase [Sphaerochaeta]|jgi:L-rhamnose mutarotase|uniref:L-rhamnose mutarotase n=2 Tax=root TaxID=1 RepID=A0ABY4D7R3_9SPIR|nr:MULTISPECIES: L-rhamnose mutarotase [Sphaerochaeta]MDD3456625.1 L-rhamnose mutarotase [Sphaerochaeta sp.]UOM50333.1 L-rhamnose mutarotase [Sphaerochaeta associata]SMP42724.1 L-rhamnose mutarotase [Sphaerochaeta associata]
MRKAFVMQLKKGCEAEYQKRHNEIWPELKALLSESGVFDYTIFLERETGKLFAFQQVKGQAGSQGLGGNPIVQKWWAYMADLMETHPDNSPVSTPLEEVFHMD